VVVRDAKVPVVKFEMDGVKIDLVFADLESPVNLSGTLNKH
jgi:poly(A) polymerase Pap1